MTLPEAASVAENPSQEQLRAWVLQHMPNITETEFGNINYKAEVKARLGGSTFFVDDHEQHKPSMSRVEYEDWAAKQDAYIADKDMVLIEGYIGPDAAFRTATRLYMERTSSNIPAMQQQLYFPKDDEWDPRFTVIYTPGMPAPGKPGDKMIAVDHE
ncbi:MAG: phosphoenolpyruvate carboxykinase (ATP), partial [Actinomycetota bacterium]|nr:phosphoenolpyruvate carboxykinase (ATP) [Actinomycetota bacterium]